MRKKRCPSKRTVIIFTHCRYKSDDHKAKQFPLDCQELATAQCIYAHQLLSIGVVDEIIWEAASGADEREETFEHFPKLQARLDRFISESLQSLLSMSADEIVKQRYDKFRSLGTFLVLDEEGRSEAVRRAEERKGKPKTSAPATPKISSKLLTHLAVEIVTGGQSRYRNLCPPLIPFTTPPVPKVSSEATLSGWQNAKSVLDEAGPEGLIQWVKQQKKVYG